MPILRLKPEWMLGNTPEVKNGKLPNGQRGNLKTVDMIIKVARARSRHPLVRELTLRVLETAGIKSQDYVNEAIAVGNFVKNKVRYVRDIQGVETLHDPLTLIDQLRRGEAQGDCDDMSLLIASMLLSIGHQPYLAIVQYHDNPFGGFNHIYVVVYEKNWSDTKRKRIVLDAILKRSVIGTEVKYKNKREIKI